MDNKDTFNYTYSAKEQEELKAIRKKYSVSEEEEEEEKEDKMTKLRLLDASVTRKASTAALVIGIIGALIMGLGMSLIMTTFGNILGSMSMPLGVIIGVVGIALVIAAYPTYNGVIKKEREKVAPEIIRLTDELLK